MTTIPATWMRGGTSKCWVFRSEDLQVPGLSVDEVLLGLFGSPDPRQVDGVGGGTSTTSKAVILAPSTAPGVDVDYTFAQVGIEDGVVDWGSNCGNCSAVVGPFALEAGWVTPTQPRTDVRVLNTNTGQLMVHSVPTAQGGPDETVTTTIPGVQHPGALVELGFVDPAGRSTGSLFPSGAIRQTLTAGGGELSATLVDAGAPVVVLDATELGLSATETAADLDSRADLLALLDVVRRAAAVEMGLVDDPADAAKAIPKLALVAPSADPAADLAVRMLSMGRLHPALPITGSVALTLAARTAGTVVAEALGEALPEDREHLTMLTPAGPVTTRTGTEAGATYVAATRTYRRIADAQLHLPRRLSALHVDPHATASSVA